MHTYSCISDVSCSIDSLVHMHMDLHTVKPHDSTHANVISATVQSVPDGLQLNTHKRECHSWCGLLYVSLLSYMLGRSF